MRDPKLPRYIIRSPVGDTPYFNEMIARLKLVYVAHAMPAGTTVSAIEITKDGERILATCERAADGRVMAPQHLVPRTDGL